MLCLCSSPCPGRYGEDEDASYLPSSVVADALKKLDNAKLTTIVEDTAYQSAPDEESAPAASVVAVELDVAKPLQTVDVLKPIAQPVTSATRAMYLTPRFSHRESVAERAAARTTGEEQPYWV